MVFFAAERSKLTAAKELIAVIHPIPNKLFFTFDISGLFASAKRCVAPAHAKVNRLRIAYSDAAFLLLLLYSVNISF